MIPVPFGEPIPVSTSTLILPTRTFRSFSLLRFVLVNEGPLYRAQIVVETFEREGYPDMSADVSAEFADAGKQCTVVIDQSDVHTFFRAYARTLQADGFPTVNVRLCVIGVSPGSV